MTNQQIRWIYYSLVIILITQARADDLGSKITKVGQDYAIGYLQPLTNAFGADINSEFLLRSGFTEGFHFAFGIKAFGAVVPSSEQSFDLVEHGTVHFDQLVGLVHVVKDVPYTLTGTGLPTIFGNDKVMGFLHGRATFDTLGQHYEYNVGDSIIGGILNTSLAPLAAPQLTIGSYLGTDLSLRWIPSISITDFGSVGFWGIGIQHDLSRYFKEGELPVNLSVGVAIQKLTISTTDTTSGTPIDYNLLDATTLLIDVNASRTLGIVTLYGGLQLESASMDFQYYYSQYIQDNGTVHLHPHFTLNAKNTYRALLGGNISIGHVNFNVGLNIGSTFVLSSGLGMAF